MLGFQRIYVTMQFFWWLNYDISFIVEWTWRMNFKG
jgi:hypothetical protein